MPPSTLAAGETISLAGSNIVYVVVVAVIALLALLMSFYFRRQVLEAPAGTAKMQEIAGAVQEGANAFLRRLFTTLAGFAGIACLALLVLPGAWHVRIGRSIFFLVGAGFSALIGYMGMWLAVRANVRPRRRTGRTGDSQPDLPPRCRAAHPPGCGRRTPR